MKTSTELTDTLFAMVSKEAGESIREANLKKFKTHFIAMEAT